MESYGKPESSEKSLVVLSHGTTWFSNFYNMKFETLVEFTPLLGVKKKKLILKTLYEAQLVGGKSVATECIHKLGRRVTLRTSEKRTTPACGQGDYKT